MPSCSSPRPGDFHRVAFLGFAHAQRHVAFRLAQQAVADHAAGHLVAFGAGQRRIVHPERHRERRRIDRLRAQRRLDFGRADGVRHGRVRQPRDGDDVAGPRLVDRRALEPAERQHFGDAAALDQLAVMVEHLDLLVRLDASRKHAAGDDAPEIRIGLEDGAEQAERTFLDRRRLHVPEHQLEQRRHAVVVRAVELVRHPALLGRAVEDRKVELLVGRVERREQVEHLVEHFGRARVRAIDLVDHHDRLEPHAQRLRHHELGLRQRSLGGIDQHQRAVHHVEDALDLAAEIGVARRIDDVDARVLPQDRGRLGEDRDAALALQIVRIHRPLDLALVVAIGAGLLQQPVDQRGLAMVDVGDDRHVAEIHE